MRTLSRGFTLIELLIVIVIILLLMAISLPVLSKMRGEQKKVLAFAQVKAIADAARAYFEELGQYPPDTDSFETGDIRDGYYDPESIAKYLGRKVSNKSTGTDHGPFLIINQTFVKKNIYYDPWNEPYQMDCVHPRVITDKGPQMGKVERVGEPYPPGTEQEKRIVEVKAWSGGPDKNGRGGSAQTEGRGQTQTDQDNITSWAN